MEVVYVNAHTGHLIKHIEAEVAPAIGDEVTLMLAGEWHTFVVLARNFKYQAIKDRTVITIGIEGTR